MLVRISILAILILFLLTVFRGAVFAQPVAEAQPALEERQAFEIPRSEVHEIRSEKLGRTYDLYIKLPPGYGKPENASERYPVIYLNDGPYTFQVASGVTRLPLIMGEFEKVILVGISFAKGEGGQASRSRDLTPWEIEGAEYKHGGARDYFEFIRTEVIGYVETNFRADPARRVLSGQSYGGLFGAWVLLTAPETFNAYILTSPSLWSKDKAIFDLEKAYAEKHDDLPATVYFATGERETFPYYKTHDMLKQQSEFAAQLRARGYSSLVIRNETIPDGLHVTTFPVGFTRAMQWLFHVHE